MPSERKLSEKLKISRPAVKVALDRLLDSGAITRRGGSGSYISEPLPSQAVDAVQVPDVGIMDLIEFRRLVEPQILGDATLRATDQDFARIEARLEEMRRAESASAYKQASYSFTREIARATRNPLCTLLFDIIFTTRTRLGWDEMKGLSDTPERRRQRIARNAELLMAMRERDRTAVVKIQEQTLEKLVQDILRLASNGES